MAFSFVRSPLLAGIAALGASAAIATPAALVVLPTGAAGQIRDIVEGAQADISVLRADIRSGHVEIHDIRLAAATEVRGLLDGPNTDRDAVEAVVADSRTEVTSARQMIAADHTEIRDTKQQAAHDIGEVVKADRGEVVQEIAAIVEPARAQVDAEKETITSGVQSIREIRRATADEVKGIVGSAKDGDIEPADAAAEISDAVTTARADTASDKADIKTARASITSIHKETATSVRHVVKNHRTSKRGNRS